MRDVEKLLRLPRSTIRGLIKAGFVSPARGPRKTYLFSFQDLIVLRTAQALAASKVPAKRITKSLQALRRQIPETMPLSGFAISAVGDRVVVKEGGSRWRVDSGQYVLAFEGNPAEGRMQVIESKAPPAGASADDWFEQGYALEDDDLEAAREAYEKALAADPAHVGASINLGRLLHDAGRVEDAERTYRRAIAQGAKDALLWYNLGVLLSDRGRQHDALEAYEAALRLNPRMVDCHYNMALVCELLQKHKEAIRHMAQYRRLSKG
ncbi:MAG: tetratricopeptide repeat protein [Sulfurifustis sp.]